MGEKTPPTPTPTPTNHTTSFPPSLPPGCRFYPSDEQLISYYLSSKNNNLNLSGFDLIKEINLYNFEPYNLPDIACFRYGRGGGRRHWFCYVAEGRGGLRERGGRRRAGCGGGGYWKRRGRVRNVVCDGAGRVVVGTRKCFVFYVAFGGQPETHVRTDWFMYEYALIDNPKASFVLCRVFIKSHHVNNLLEPVLSSCAEGTVAPVRHRGTQYDGTVELVIAEAKADDEFPVGYNNGGSNNPMRLISELADLVSNHPHPEQVSLNNALTSQELVAILEDDFLELDDLVSPLRGID